MKHVIKICCTIFFNPATKLSLVVPKCWSFELQDERSWSVPHDPNNSKLTLSVVGNQSMWQCCIAADNCVCMSGDN